MKITDIVATLALILVFIYMILYSIRIKRGLIIERMKRKIYKITVFIVVSILIGIIYFYAKTPIHYIFSILCISIICLTLFIKEGITEEGFTSMRWFGIIKWNKISSVTVTIKKDIKISILGELPISILGKLQEEIFYFNKKDYNEIIKIISSNLPVRAKLNIKS